VKSQLAVARRALQVVRVWIRHFAIPAVRRRPATERAERAQAALEELGGAWVKLGQALALRFDLLPEDYCLQFFRLLNQMRPFPAEQVRKVLEQDLGRPVEQLFRNFDFAPIAAASIGQVHRAELPDGTVVAVKVQRPEICDLIRSDLRVMHWLATVVDLLPGAGGLRARQLVTEFAHWSEEELDYRREARHASLLRYNAQGDPLEHNAQVFLSHSAARVLTLEYIKGIAVIDIVTAIRRKDAAFLGELASRGHDLKRIASHIVWNALNQIYRQGCFHADLHPANLLVLAGDAIGYVDFGIVGQLDRRTTDSLRYFAQSLFAGRVDLAVREFARFLVPSHRTDPDAARRDLVDALRAYVESARVRPNGFAPESIFEIEMLALVRKHAMALDPDVVRYLKAVLTVEASVKEIDPSFDLIAHENRFFARLVRIEAAEALTPDRIGQLLLDMRMRVGGLLDGFEGLPTAQIQLGAVADNVRWQLQVSCALAIGGWLALSALVWMSGNEALRLRPLFRIVTLGGALAILGLLILTLWQVRRLPPRRTR